MAAVDVSVIVPVRDDAAALARLIDALGAQTLENDRWELIVVDDESPTPMTAPGAKLVRLDARTGSYGARNAGIEVASGAALAFTDADCVPADDWLAAGLAALADAPRVAGRVDVTTANDASFAERLDAGRFLRQARYVDEGFGATANLWMRREVIDTVGPFDGRLRSGGDAEHGRRATSAGFEIVYADDVVVRHPARQTLAAVLAKAERVGFGFGQTVRLHGLDPSRFAARARDRANLAGGGRRVAAAHALMGCATAAGVVRGFVAGKNWPR